jgi:hypothetical protein
MTEIRTSSVNTSQQGSWVNLDRGCGLAALSLRFFFQILLRLAGPSPDVQTGRNTKPQLVFAGKPNNLISLGS